METWDHREAEPSSLFSNSWPRRGRLSEREQSQLVLDQVLIHSCKPAPVYTQFLTYLVKLRLTYLIDVHPLARQRIQLRTWLVQVLRGRFRFCLHWHICLSVSFVSRLSRSHSLLAFFAVLGFRISLVNFTVYLAFLSLWTLAYCWHSSCFIVFEFLWLKSLYFQPFSSCTSVFQ